MPMLFSYSKIKMHFGAWRRSNEMAARAAY